MNSVPIATIIFFRSLQNEKKNKTKKTKKKKQKKPLIDFTIHNLRTLIVVACV